MVWKYPGLANLIVAWSHNRSSWFWLCRPEPLWDAFVKFHAFWYTKLTIWNTFSIILCTHQHFWINITIFSFSNFDNSQMKRILNARSHKTSFNFFLYFKQPQKYTYNSRYHQIISKFSNPFSQHQIIYIQNIFIQSQMYLIEI